MEQYGDTKLPDSVLVRVMECLADTREPGGLRGFACVSKDLANASLVGACVVHGHRACMLSIGVAGEVHSMHFAKVEAKCS